MHPWNLEGTVQLSTHSGTVWTLGTECCTGKGLGQRWVEGGGRTSLVPGGEPGRARTRSRSQCPGSRMRGRASHLYCPWGVTYRDTAFTEGSAGSRLGKLSLWQPHWPPSPTAFYRDPGMGRCRPMRPSPMCSKAAGPRARPYWGLCWTSSAVLGAKGPAGWASSSGGQGALPPPRPYLSWVHPSPGVLCMDV